MKTIYFKDTFEFDTLTKTVLGGLLLISLMLVPRYKWTREEKFLWWSPIVLEIIVAHVMVFLQMLFEWMTLNQRIDGWKKDLMFRQQYQSNDDASETFLRTQINSLIINADAENRQAFEDGPQNNKKAHKLNATFFTVTYCSLMKQNKQKFKMN